MATVGEQLKAAREAQRLSVHRVAEVTRMRTDQVLAIEAGNHTTFVAPVYLRGFIRAYARSVHLDEAAVLAQLDQESGRATKPVEPARSPDESEPGPGWVASLDRLRWGRAGAVVAGIVVALIGFLLVRSWSDGEKGSTIGPPPAVYHPDSLDSGEMLPVPQPPEEGE